VCVPDDKAYSGTWGERKMRRLSPDAWRRIGYIRDVLIIAIIALGALYLSWHPEKFDAFMYWLIGHRYRH
jgi:hypothetical protein